MKKYKYYIVYGLSLVFILFIWLGPLTQRHEIDVVYKKDTGILYSITPEPEPDKSNFWVFLSKTNGVLTFIVGSVNVYFIVKHILEKREKRKLLEKKPKRFGYLLRNIFTRNKKK